MTYANNREDGTATMTTTGIGNYSGTLTVCFAIKGKEQSAGPPFAQQAAMFAAGTTAECFVIDRSSGQEAMRLNEEARSGKPERLSRTRWLSPLP